MEKSRQHLVEDLDELGFQAKQLGELAHSLSDYVNSGEVASESDLVKLDELCLRVLGAYREARGLSD